MGTNVAAQNGDCHFTLVNFHTRCRRVSKTISISKTYNALATLKLGLNGNFTHKPACVKTRLHDATRICTKGTALHCINHKWTYFRDCCLVHMSQGSSKISTFHATFSYVPKKLVNILRFFCVSHDLVVASVNAA